MFLKISDIGYLDSQSIGTKAYNLAKLYSEGYNVPPGCIITADEFIRFINDNGLRSIVKDYLNEIYQTGKFNSAIRKKLEGLKEKIITRHIDEKLLKKINNYVDELVSGEYSSVVVRSSATLEDLADKSFAGQYDTVLNVKTDEELEKSIITCWMSIFNERVINYCLSRNIDHSKIKMGVVIQAMVPSMYSGVLFTVDPIQGKDRKMVVEAIHGQGEAIVQGLVTPDSYSFDWYHEKIEVNNKGKQKKGLYPSASEAKLYWKNVDSKNRVLSEAQIREIGLISLKIQEHFGVPQDIEWAFWRDKFFIVQSRPLSKISYNVNEEWTNADFRDGGIASSIPTPFMWSLYKYVFDTTMPEYLHSNHIKPNQPPKHWTKIFFGYPYWNLSATKGGVKKIPGFVERKFDEDLGIEPNYEGDGHKTGFTPLTIINGVRILLAINKSIKSRPKKNEVAVRKILKIINDLNTADLQLLDNTKLLRLITKTIEQDYLYTEGNYFFTIYDNSNATTLFHDALETYNKKIKEKLKHIHLIAGIQDISHLNPTMDFWKLTREILKDEKELEKLLKLTPDSVCELHNQNETYPFKEQVLSYLEKYKYHSIRELDILVPHWIEDPLPVFKNMFDMLQSDSNPLEANQKQVESYSKEKNKIKSKKLQRSLNQHRKLLWWREEMRDYSTQFYFQLRRITQELGRRLVAEGILSKKDDLYFLSFKEALDFFAGNNEDHYKKQIQKNKAYYNSFRNFEKPNEIIPNQGPWEKRQYSETNSFRGIACSPGVIEGEVSVVISIDKLDQLRTETILVTKFTDTGWTPVFSKIAGLITETGGLLSHGAIVSREFGIPAVLAVSGITEQLKSGMRVRLNGDTGQVTVL